MNHYVYMLRIEGEGLPFYIGMGTDDRHLVHFSEARNDFSYSSNRHKLNTIRKAWAEGKEVFSEIILDGLDRDQALANEIEFIRYFGRRDIGTGCLTNMTDGGDGGSGMIWTEEAKKLKSESTKGELNPMYGRRGEASPIRGVKNGFFGKVHSKEAIERNRQAHLGKTASSETKTKMSEARRGDKNSNYGLKPWLVSAAKPANIQARWKKAPQLFRLWKEAGEPGYPTLQRLEGNSENLQRMVQLFKQGWNPEEDPTWIEHFAC